jgi:mono/diheme cytochrome c family protein
MRRSLVVVPLACVALAAGCGGGGKSASSSTQASQSTEPALPKGDPVAGKKVWEDAGCGTCHTLKAADAHGAVGPNLDHAKPDLRLILDRVANGQGVMPSFVDQLSEQDMTNVAAFVFQSTHGS